jgi:hypothetical protein
MIRVTGTMKRSIGPDLREKPLSVILCGFYARMPHKPISSLGIRTYGTRGIGLRKLPEDVVKEHARNACNRVFARLEIR